jgi:hypothetical protein
MLQFARLVWRAFLVSIFCIAATLLNKSLSKISRNQFARLSVGKMNDFI